MLVLDRAVGARGLTPSPPSRLQMPLPLRPGLEPRGVALRDLAYALRRVCLLRQRHASVEHLRIAADPIAFEVEAADAVEEHAGTLGVGMRGGIAEPVAGIADIAGADGVVEL